MVDAISSLLPTLHRAQRSPGYQSALIALLRDAGATSLFTFGLHALATAQQAAEGLSNYANSVILLRYMERGAELGRVLSVLKMRRSNHDKGLLRFEIDENGLNVIGHANDVRQITGWNVLGGSTAG